MVPSEWMGESILFFGLRQVGFWTRGHPRFRDFLPGDWRSKPQAIEAAGRDVSLALVDADQVMG